MIPPDAKSPVIPAAVIWGARARATASEVAPAPVWNRKPSRNSPEQAMSRAVNPAIACPVEDGARPVVPEAMRPASPMLSVGTIASTCRAGMQMRGRAAAR